MMMMMRMMMIRWLHQKPPDQDLNCFENRVLNFIKCSRQSVLIRSNMVHIFGIVIISVLFIDSDLKEKFPVTRDEVCTNTWIHHSIWEYVCLTFDLSEVRDPDNRCR